MLKINKTILYKHLRTSPLVFYLIAIALGFMIYSNILTHSCFQDDDQETIVNNLSIRHLSDVQSIFHSFHSRFIVGLSFALNYWAGGLQSWGYHLFNIIIHIFSSMLAYQLVLLLFQTPRMQQHPCRSSQNLLAMAVGLIFLTHPLQTESINFLTQRFSSLAGFFSLLTVTFYLKARIKNSRRLFVFAFLSTVAAMFSKENTVTLPFLLVFIEGYFWGDLTNCLRERLMILLPFLLTLIIIPLTLLQTPLDTSPIARIANISVDVDPQTKQVIGKKIDITRANLALDRKDYLLSQINVMVTYLRLYIWPINQNLDYNYPVTKNFFELKTLGSAVIILFLIFLIYFSFQTDRLISFGLLWYFFTLLPESSIIPIGYLIGEHRLYLPIVGLTMAISLGLARILRTPQQFGWAILLLIVILSLATYQRNNVWTDPLLLWNDVILKSPQKPRGYNNRGVIYALRSQHQNAIADYTEAIKMKPNYPEAYKNRGISYYRIGNREKALLDFNQAITLFPDYAEAYFNRALLHHEEGNTDKALADYSKAIELNPKYIDAFHNRGFLLKEKGETLAALENFNQAIAVDSKNAESYENRGIYFYREGNFDNAIADFTSAIKFNPHSSKAYLNRGNASCAQGNYSDGIADYTQAIHLNPSWDMAYNNRGIAQLRQKKFLMAIQDFTEALHRNPVYAEAYNNRGNVFFSQKQFDKAIADYTQAIKINPNYGQAWHNRGVANYYWGKHPEAKQDLEKAASLGMAIDPGIKFLIKQDDEKK